MLLLLLLLVVDNIRTVNQTIKSVAVFTALADVDVSSFAIAFATFFDVEVAPFTTASATLWAIAELVLLLITFLILFNWRTTFERLHQTFPNRGSSISPIPPRELPLR